MKKNTLPSANQSQVITSISGSISARGGRDANQSIVSNGGIQRRFTGYQASQSQTRASIKVRNMSLNDRSRTRNDKRHFTQT